MEQTDTGNGTTVPNPFEYEGQAAELPPDVCLTTSFNTSCARKQAVCVGSLAGSVTVPVISVSLTAEKLKISFPGFVKTGKL